MESKLRMLVRDLKDNTPLIKVAHPYIEGKSKVTICKGDDEIRSAAAGIPPAQVHSEDEPGTSKVWTTTFYIGLDLKQTDKGKLICLRRRFGILKHFPLQPADNGNRWIFHIRRQHSLEQ